MVAALVLAVLGVPAHARADDEARSAANRSTPYFRETGCTEIGYLRGGLTSAVRPLVPERFALVDYPGFPEGSPPRVELYVNEVTCDRGRFLRGNDSRHYTYLIVSAFVTSSEGDQRDGSYVLFFATESREQRVALRRAGWPVIALSKRTTALITRDTGGTPVGAALHVVGGRWDHDIAAVANSALSSVETSTYGFYRDTATGPSTLCFANRAAVAGASYSGDLRGTPFATVAYVPPQFTGYPATLVVGDWDATVTPGACPASTARRMTVPQRSPSTQPLDDQRMGG